MTAVDDQTALYILATRNAFEDLRQVVSQLAGVTGARLGEEAR